MGDSHGGLGGGVTRMQGRRRFGRRGEHGQVIPIVALLALVITGFAAISLDTGMAYAQSRGDNDISDAAALAGAYGVTDSQPGSAGTSLLWLYTAEQNAANADGCNAGQCAGPRDHVRQQHLSGRRGVDGQRLQLDVPPHPEHLCGQCGDLLHQCEWHLRGGHLPGRLGHPGRGSTGQRQDHRLLRRRGRGAPGRHHPQCGGPGRGQRGWERVDQPAAGMRGLHPPERHLRQQQFLRVADERWQPCHRRLRGGVEPWHRHHPDQQWVWDRCRRGDPVPQQHSVLQSTRAGRPSTRRAISASRAMSSTRVVGTSPSRLGVRSTSLGASPTPGAGPSVESPTPGNSTTPAFKDPYAAAPTPLPTVSGTPVAWSTTTQGGCASSENVPAGLYTSITDNCSGAVTLNFSGQYVLEGTSGSTVGLELDGRARSPWRGRPPSTSPAPPAAAEAGPPRRHPPAQPPKPAPRWCSMTVPARR